MRLSYSGLNKLDRCPRLWQIDSLFKVDNEPDENGHTMFGKALEAGIAHLLINPHDTDGALVASFLKWKDKLKIPPKYLEVLFAALLQFDRRWQYDRYVLLYKDDTPLVGTGVRIWKDKARKDYFLLYIDAVIYDTELDAVLVLEIKTTKQREAADVLYSNSPQSLYYSLVLPQLLPEYSQHAVNTLYLIVRIPNIYEPEIELLEIEQTDLTVLQLLLTLHVQFKRLDLYVEHDVFPKTGNCTAFGRTCPHFGMCDKLPLVAQKKTLKEQNKPRNKTPIVCDILLNKLTDYYIQQTATATAE
jgi:hypothetical protein